MEKDNIIQDIDYFKELNLNDNISGKGNINLFNLEITENIRNKLKKIY